VFDAVCSNIHAAFKYDLIHELILLYDKYPNSEWYMIASGVVFLDNLKTLLRKFNPIYYYFFGVPMLVDGFVTGVPEISSPIILSSAAMRLLASKRNYMQCEYVDEYCSSETVISTCLGKRGIGMEYLPGLYSAVSEQFGLAKCQIALVVPREFGLAASDLTAPDSAQLVRSLYPKIEDQSACHEKCLKDLNCVASETIDNACQTHLKITALRNLSVIHERLDCSNYS
jgi:hypothetical protein